MNGVVLTGTTEMSAVHSTLMRSITFAQAIQGEKPAENIT